MASEVHRLQQALVISIWSQKIYDTECHKHKTRPVCHEKQLDKLCNCNSMTACSWGKMVWGKHDGQQAKATDSD